VIRVAGPCRQPGFDVATGFVRKVSHLSDSFDTAFAELRSSIAEQMAEEDRQARQHIREYFEHAPYPSEAGLALTDATMCKALAVHGVGQGRLRDGVAVLVEEGHLFSTIDDEHYAATSRGPLTHIPPAEPFL